MVAEMIGPAGLGLPPELAWLPVDRLEVDPAYQRSLDSRPSQKLIEKIADNFSWMRFQAILATPKGKGDETRWLVIDGQHRCAAARKRGILHVPAVVVAEASLADQALAFVGANHDRVKVSAQAIFHARAVSGDPDCAAIKELCARCGISIERSNKAVKQLAAGRTAAVSVLVAIGRWGYQLRANTVIAVAEHFAGQPGALSGALFRGAAIFLRDGGSFEALRRALARFDIRRLDEWNRLGHSSGGSEVAGELKRLASRGSVSATPESAGPAATAMPPTPGVPANGPSPASVPQKSGDGGTLHPGKAAPFKAGPLPVVRDGKRDADQDQIARYLAEKGARQVMGAEQVAAFLRDSGHRCVIREVNESKNNAPKYVPHPELDGKPVSLERLYELANELRAKAGLKPVFPAQSQGKAA